MRLKKALIVADDAEIFVLLCCCKEDILVPASTSAVMVSPINGCMVLDINATLNQYCDIIPTLLAAPGLTGCDTIF